MAIIKKQKLIEKINDYNLIPLEVNALNISNQIHLNIDKIEDFLKFASDWNSGYLYYYYTYYHSGEYIIPLDWYSEYSKEFKIEVRQYNQHIKSLDFASPKSLTLFVLQNGTYVGVVLENPWMDNQGISVAEEAIEVIENKFYREVKKISANKKVQQKEDENELREIIFNDPEFKLCKNQALRYRYLIELLEKENMMKYDYLVQPYGYYKDGKVKWFMDVTWELYKERNK
jgi:16S rRNA G966 N2-methylase RsmD